MLHSITQINKQFETSGSKPILVSANDYYEYVCKYQRNPSVSFSSQLVCEFIGSALLTNWNIESPQVQVIKINPEHIKNESLKLQPAWFLKPCFGSRYNRYYKEVDKFFEISSRGKTKPFREDHLLLKIALFDLWVANEDRHGGNYNLLLDTVNNGKPIPIDHASIFNSTNFTIEPTPLTFEDSVISSPLLLATYTKKELSNQKTIDTLKTYYYVCIQKSKEEFPKTLELIPPEWCQDKNELYTQIEKKLFQDSWIKETWKNFLYHLQLSINTKQ